MTKAYTPSDGYRDKNVFPVNPVSEDAARDDLMEIPDQMLAFHNDHINETVSKHIFTTRDISVEGTQPVALPFLAKSIKIDVVVSGTKVMVSGVWSESGGQSCVGIDSNGNGTGTGTNAIYLFMPGGIAIGQIQNVTASGFDISWTKTTLPTGTAFITILAYTHV